MGRPTKLDAAMVDSWAATHPGWGRVHDGAIAKEYRFTDFGAALAFVVRVGAAAEKRDHHPDVELGWGRAKVTWTTHDAGGITQLDLELAAATDDFAAGSGAKG